jgi:very-short-patch-repair endonuclease
MNFESPIEQKLFEAVSPWVKPEIQLTPQVEVQTKRGLRRLDFLLTDGRTGVVVECDGAAYHNFDSDLDRDVALFLSGAHAIFHFSGTFINRNASILAPIIAYFVPDFFTETPNLDADCPTVGDGFYMRLAPDFPGLRETMLERVIEAPFLYTLSACRNLTHTPIDAPIYRMLLEEAARRAKERAREKKQELIQRANHFGDKP